MTSAEIIEVVKVVMPTIAAIVAYLTLRQSQKNTVIVHDVQRTNADLMKKAEASEAVTTDTGYAIRAIAGKTDVIHDLTNSSLSAAEAKIAQRDEQILGLQNAILKLAERKTPTDKRPLGEPDQSPGPVEILAPTPVPVINVEARKDG